MIAIEFLKDDIKHRYPPTDIGTSNLFIDSFKDELLYCAEKNTWFVWNGKVWAIDCMLKRNEMIKKLAFYCKQYIFSKADDESKQKLLEYYSKLNSKNFRDIILKDSMSIAPVSATDFNKDKYLFNCRNGTYDFRTKQFKSHDRNDMITDISNVKYDQNAECPRFEKYLLEVMENSTEKIDYLMKIAAYCMTGDTTQECFFILYGDKTRNGKGTFVGTMTHLAGTYAETLRPAAITRKQQGGASSNATPEIAKLVNSRMVNVNELEDNMLLDVALMKTLTGGDTMAARQLYEKEFNFVPQFKIVINTNVLPKMTDDTIFNSDRVHILSFDRYFEKTERDMGLKDKLKSEVSGIFNWIVMYWDKLQREGFIIPRQSQQVIKDYHLMSNNIMAFIKERLYPNKSAYEKVSEVYQEYTYWCEESGYHTLGKKTFKERIARKGAIFTGKERHKNSDGESENTFWMNGFSLSPPKNEQIQVDSIINTGTKKSTANDSPTDPPREQINKAVVHNYAQSCIIIHKDTDEYREALAVFSDNSQQETAEKNYKNATETGGIKLGQNTEKVEQIGSKIKEGKNEPKNDLDDIDPYGQKMADLTSIADEIPY